MIHFLVNDIIKNAVAMMLTNAAGGRKEDGLEQPSEGKFKKTEEADLDIWKSFSSCLSPRRCQGEGHACVCVVVLHQRGQ